MITQKIDASKSAAYSDKYKLGGMRPKGTGDNNK
jgi:hypothetical protein